MRWLSIAFFSALDLVLAFCLTFFVDSDEKVSVFFVTLGVLWLLPLLTGGWNFIKFWIGYHAFIRTRMARHYRAQMHQFSFPNGGGFSDTQAFLSHVLDADWVEPRTKHKAAFCVGELTAYRDAKPMTLGVAADLSFLKAMDEYKPSFYPSNNSSSEQEPFFRETL